MLQRPFNLSCLNAMADSPISHDNFFDTLLGIMSVKTKTYDIDNDPFNHCKSPEAIVRLNAIDHPNQEIKN